MFTLFILAVSAWMAVGINHGLDCAKVMSAKAFEFLAKFATRKDIEGIIAKGGAKDASSVLKSFDKILELRSGKYAAEIRCMDRKTIGRLCKAIFIVQGALKGPFAKYKPDSIKRAKIFNDYCVEHHPLNR